MGGIRRIVIGAHDDHGGAIELLDKSRYLSSKNIEIIWMQNIYGDIQRGLQTIRELLYNEDKAKSERMLMDFSVYNSSGENAAKILVDNGLFVDLQKCRLENIIIHIMIHQILNSCFAINPGVYLHLEIFLKNFRCNH